MSGSVCVDAILVKKPYTRDKHAVVSATGRFSVGLYIAGGVRPAGCFDLVADAGVGCNTLGRPPSFGRGG